MTIDDKLREILTEVYIERPHVVEPALKAIQQLINQEVVRELKVVQKEADKLERMDTCGCDTYLPKRIAQLKSLEKEEL